MTATKYGAASIEEFDAMAPNQKRVLLARDVLDRLTKETISPHRGQYLVVEYPSHPFKGNDKAVEVVNNNTCQACALGSMFIAYISIKNGLLARDCCDSFYLSSQTFVLDPRPLSDKILEVFSKEQMALIEIAFEGGVNSPIQSYIQGYDLMPVPIKAYKKMSPRIAMTAIMQNIIDNDGTFVPPEE